MKLLQGLSTPGMKRYSVSVHSDGSKKKKQKKKTKTKEVRGNFTGGGGGEGRNWDFPCISPQN